MDMDKTTTRASASTRTFPSKTRAPSRLRVGISGAVRTASVSHPSRLTNPSSLGRSG